MNFIRERQYAKYGCRYKEADWFDYSDEEEEKIKLPRRERTRTSLPKIKNLNDEYSRKYFRIIFHNNFIDGDYFVTLSFAQPTDRKRAQKEFTNFIKRLRRLYRKAGSELKYLYVYEGKCKGTRPHFHLIVNKIPSVDRDTIEQTWGKGYTRSKVLRNDGNGLCDLLCNYLAKETKQSAKYERSWNGSTNLMRPDRVTDDNSVTKRRMRKLFEAQRNDEVKKYVETFYTGWELIDYKLETNEKTGRRYARFRLLRKPKSKTKKKGKSP